MVKNDEIILKINDVTSEGSGIGRYEEMAVFVPLTAIGDTVKVKVLKVKKTFAYGKVLEIINSSEDRIVPDCDVFNKCGGCAYRHISYDAECRLKQNTVKETIKRIGGAAIDPSPILYGKADYYRNKAQFPIDLNGKAGFYAFHSHRIISCNNCKLQPAVFSDIIALCEVWIKEFNISIYDELKHKGILRHLYLRIAEITGEIMITFVVNSDRLPFSDEIIKGLTQNFPQIKSIQININKEDTNVILGKKCVCLYGEQYITDDLCGVKVRLSPLSFYQVNREMAEILYKKTAEYVQPSDKNILDLYCGAGTIGLSMAKTAKSIIGVEIIPEAVSDAKFNAMQNNVNNARFICADATEAAEQLAAEGIKIDVVIVDPPRKGCTQGLINTIAKEFSPERVIYVSCDVATLSRDIKIFDSYGYKLKEYTPVDLFPRTAHVETVALLIKN